MGRIEQALKKADFYLSDASTIPLSEITKDPMDLFQLKKFLILLPSTEGDEKQINADKERYANERELFDAHRAAPEAEYRDVEWLWLHINKVCLELAHDLLS